ncbi:response regulator [Flavitalea sp. BT771]|uniref:response regulator n=1 Tax=Flavitalea sp. BT771 TaxID=3063329 RepID=UPI0026E30C3F|nr:response regulator [Flavitalea sp. BT771]MDO6434640.1 response regulator [Flavitalea sp. BT771]MDV6223540.1 response regulator [Flavitalea sp. BT771]
MQPKILIVDDREDNLLSIETVLEPDGYRIVKANSGRQVLKILLSDFDFALILMDVQMPNLNGFETASLIYERERLRHIPIIFITANNYGEENIFKGYRAGAVDYIYKPVNPELLRAKVSVFVDLYRKNHRLLAQEQKLVAINKSLELEIHERKVSEEKVIELNRELLENIARLETANKDLDLFAFMASHDLQAPLRKIRMFSDRLLSDHRQNMNKDGQMYLSRIQEVSKRMQDLINDILRFSKISGEKESFQEVDLNEVVKEVISEMDGPIREKKAEIILDPLPVLPVNAVLMVPLFSNLINNSLKYSKKQELPKIHIRHEVMSSGAKDPDPRYCRILIEDNGIGFDQKYAEQIFDMFRRLHPSAEYEGTGIGLALCKKIVEKHKGFISARGKPGEGAVFIVSLPLNTVKREILA